jgi:hypothetical protein
MARVAPLLDDRAIERSHDSPGRRRPGQLAAVHAQPGVQRQILGVHAIRFTGLACEGLRPFELLAAHALFR